MRRLWLNTMANRDTRLAHTVTLAYNISWMGEVDYLEHLEGNLPLVNHVWERTARVRKMTSTNRCH